MAKCKADGVFYLAELELDFQMQMPLSIEMMIAIFQEALPFCRNLILFQMIK